MMGFLYAVIAGAAMSFQGVMNTRMGDKAGVFETNAYVQLTGFVLALAIALIFGKGDIRQMTQAPWYAWLGGLLAPVITVTVMLSVGALSPTVAICTILLSQLAVAASIDAFGLMGSERIAFTWKTWLGLGLMSAGVLLIKTK